MLDLLGRYLSLSGLFPVLLNIYCAGHFKLLLYPCVRRCDKRTVSTKIWLQIAFEGSMDNLEVTT
jgi:hypothetical protein